jgi:hypothetical protein
MLTNCPVTKYTTVSISRSNCTENPYNRSISCGHYLLTLIKSQRMTLGGPCSTNGGEEERL